MKALVLLLILGLAGWVCRPWLSEVFPEVNFLLIVGVVVAVIVGTLVAFLPTIIGRNKKNGMAIFALNFFAGWTFVGWVVAMVWACTTDSEEDRRQARPLAVGSILTLLVFLNLVGAGVVVWMIGKAAEVAQQEIAVEEQREAERAAQQQEARAEAERVLAEENAKWEAEEAERELARKRREFAELPQWDRYGRPINRDFDVFLAEGEQATAQTAAAQPVQSIFPPGVDTPEERREYLRARKKK